MAQQAFFRHPGNEGRGLSDELWNRLRWEQTLDDPSHGFTVRDDFIAGQAQWTVTDAPTVGSTSTLTLLAADGGVGRMSTVSTTDGDGITVQTDPVSFLPTATSTIAFEVRCENNSAAAFAGNAFFGLYEATPATGVFGTDQITQDDLHCGFVFEGGSLTPIFSVGNGTTTEGSGTYTLNVAGEWSKLGFVALGDRLIDVYQDGVFVERITSDSALFNVTAGAGEMSPTLALENSAAAAEIWDVDWVQASKVYSIDQKFTQTPVAV